MTKMVWWSKCIVMVLLVAMAVTAAACSSNNAGQQPTATPTAVPSVTATPVSAATPTPTQAPSWADGTIDIKSGSIDGAKIIIDGVDTGMGTPYVATHVAAGNHTLRLECAHYKWRSGNVTVAGGETTYVNWALTYAEMQTLTIQPNESVGKDTYVDSLHPSQNFGSSNQLVTSVYSANMLCRIYIQFDVSSIPSGVVIEDAKLELYHWTGQNTSYGGYAAPVGVYKVTSAWNESDITWDNQPTFDKTAVDIITVPASAAKSYLSWNVTDLVNGWRPVRSDFNVHVLRVNYGVVLIDTDENTYEGWKSFRSSDETNPDQRPKLVITYYDPIP